MRLRRAESGITIVEAVIVSSLTIVLGIVLMLTASGWAQIMIHDMTSVTDRHVQSFRSLLVVENINYTESVKEAIIRNVSEWDIELTIVEAGVSRKDIVISRLSPFITLRKNESASIPIVVDCKRGDTYTFWVKYIPTQSIGKGFTVLDTVRNFTCPISIVSSRCSLPGRWAFVDVVDPITTLSGFFSQTYPYIWIRALKSSTTGREVLNLHIHSQEGVFSESTEIKLLDSEQTPVRISNIDIKPPYNITLEGSSVFFLPTRIEFSTYVEGDKTKIHVSGMNILWRPEDLIAEGIIIELGIFDPGDYTERNINVGVNVKDCNGRSLFSEIVEYKYTSEVGNKGDWDSIYVEFTDEFKITDIYHVETTISKIS
ncbi:MAG: hypothetical protein N3G77_06670 [Nitrososphaeria archaeon]|nr:hypothetical protein [Nitrososphaeria archaeon]